MKVRNSSLAATLGLAIGLILLSIQPLAAKCTSAVLSGTTVFNCSDRVSGKAKKVFGTAFYNLGGESGTSSTLSETTFYNFGGQFKTSRTFVGTTFNLFGGLTGGARFLSAPSIHKSGGLTGTSRSLGGFTFYGESLYND